MTPKVGFIPRTTTNAAVGGAGVPVYVKAGGEIAACTESNFDRLVDVSSYTTYSSIVAVVTAGHTPYCTSGTKKFYYQYHESASAGSFVYFGALANGRYVYRTFSQDPGAAAGSFGNTETINLTTAKMPYFEETDPEWNNLTDTGEYNITSSANVGTKNSPEGGYMSLRSVHSTNGTTEYDSQLAFGDNLYYRVKPNGGNWSNWDWIVRSKTGVCFIDTSGAIGSDLNTIYIV